MTYNPAIPQSTDLISNSQLPILDNFFQLDAQFGVDHTNFDNGGVNGDGHHKQVTFNASVTPAAPGGTASVFYPHTVGGAVQAFFQNATSTFQLTGPTSITASGYVFLPGGAILQWQKVLATDNTTIPFPLTFPTACFAVVVTPDAKTTPATIVTISGNPVPGGFTPRVSDAVLGTPVAAINIFYFAIGN